MRALIALLLFLASSAALAVDPLAGLTFYKCRVLSIHDGDTVRVDIELGLKFQVHDEPIRLNGIDAPELTGTTKVAGLAARDYLISLLISGDVVLQTVKDERDKYGRLLGVFLVRSTAQNAAWCPPAEGWCDANAQMIKAGHAVAYFGGAR